MVMSIPMLTEASTLMETALLLDTIDVFNVGEPVTVGYAVTRALTSAFKDKAALVQSTVLMNAVESQTTSTYSVKVSRELGLQAGQVIQVKTCTQEPSLVGKKLLIDKVSQNGLALIHKGVASDWEVVQQQGKGDI